MIDIAGRDRHDHVWIPAELCDIEPGQPYGVLTENQTAQMIRYACNPPKVNAEAITNAGFKSLGFNPTVSPINGFGVSIDPNMAVIPGRELPPPQLSYRVGRPNVRAGSWNILDVKFHRGVTVAGWWVLVIRDGLNMIANPQDPRLQGLVNGFKVKCQNSGMTMPSALPTLIPISLPNPRDDPSRTNAINLIKNTLKDKLTKQKPSFVLVLLEKRDGYIYPALKV